MSNEQKFVSILDSTAKKVCVIAGPGSGKTRGVIIPKTKQLIERGIDPREILLLSFSRLSAQDLKNKAQTIGSKLKASTVHSFCLTFLLSENNHNIRNRVESILMDFEKDFLVADLQLNFPHLTKRTIKKMLGKFSAGWAVSQHEDVFEHTDEEKQFKQAVINWLSENQAAMMEEIVYFAVDLAKKLPEAELLNKYKYILIDEYQDLNKLEQEFITILSKKAELLVVVGDPDQSIYSFKFAHPDGIKNLADSDDVEDHFLEYCGRSDKKILNLANQLLLQDSPLRLKLPIPLANMAEGDVNMPHFQNQMLEFEHILDSIITKNKNGIKPDDIIILVPKKKLGEQFIEYVANSTDKLSTLKIGFDLIQKPEFTENQQRQILILALLANPKSLLHLRVCLGLGDSNGFAKELKVVKEKYGNISVFFQIGKPTDFKKGRVQNLCQKALDLKNTLAQFDERKPIIEIIDSLFPTENLELVKLNGVLKSLLEEDDTVETLYFKFLENIKELPQNPDSVRIMGIMESKGLEAEHVYILGCNQGNLPGNKRSEHLTDEDHIREQRRLLYVGFTRARKSLTITWCMYIPYVQSRNHHTAGLGISIINGEKMARVGMSQFLQDLSVPS